MATSRTPNPRGPVSPILAKAIGRAVQSMLEHDELTETRAGRRMLSDWLAESACFFAREGSDVSDLIAVLRRVNAMNPTPPFVQARTA